MPDWSPPAPGGSQMTLPGQLLDLSRGQRENSTLLCLTSLMAQLSFAAVLLL